MQYTLNSDVSLNRTEFNQTNLGGPDGGTEGVQMVHVNFKKQQFLFRMYSEVVDQGKGFFMTPIKY